MSTNSASGNGNGNGNGAGLDSFKIRGWSDVVSIVSLLGMLVTVIYVYAYQGQKLNELWEQRNPASVSELKERVARIEAKVDILLTERNKN